MKFANGRVGRSSRRAATDNWRQVEHLAHWVLGEREVQSRLSVSLMT